MAKKDVAKIEQKVIDENEASESTKADTTSKSKSVKREISLNDSMQVIGGLGRRESPYW